MTMRGALQLARPVGEVDRVHRPSQEEFQREFVAKGRPAVLTGMMDDWRALERWTPDFFADRMGDRTVPVNVQKIDGPLIIGAMGEFEPMPFPDFLKRMRDPEPDKAYYLRAMPIHKMPELFDDYSIPEICPNWFDLRHNRFFRSNDRESVAKSLEEIVFIGGRGVVTPLHSDGVMTGAIVAQTMGVKRCFLVSPDQSDLVYPHPFRRSFGISSVDYRRPDFDAFPRFRDVRAVECLLNPGEIIYIPPGYWHGVESLDVSISYSLQILNSANVWSFLFSNLERIIALPYYNKRGGFMRYIGAVAWE